MSAVSAIKELTIEPTFEAWQAAAREALRQNLGPETVIWKEAGKQQEEFSLFDQFQSSNCEPPELAAQTPGVQPGIRVSRRFLELARSAALHSTPGKWVLLYRVLWRLTHDEPRLLENPADADTLALEHLDKEVQKDAYRMRAFLRFRESTLDGAPWFVAWYEPEHNTVRLNEEFFVGRFANMRWSLLTPKECMHWDLLKTTFSPGVDKSAAPANDNVEPLWVTYYSRIFNPARIKPKAMQAQLLKRNWKNLPEAAVIEPLLRQASSRTETFMRKSDSKIIKPTDYSLAQPPATTSLDKLRSAAADCKACPLWKNATCTVFGEGPKHAKIVFVGEQPGDQEDRAGKPFVGPAGQMLDRALAEAGVDRSTAYMTNAVKHFKWEPRGKRRMHHTPNARDIEACRPWLQAELNLIKPKLVVALGATASRSLLNGPIRVLQERGKILDSEFGKTLITIHPSALLRMPKDIDRDGEFQKFVADLSRVNLALGPKSS